MPPSRFAALSPWRNLAAKPLPSYSELNVSASDVGRSMAISQSKLYVRSGAGGSSLVVLSLDEDAAGKYAGKQVQTIPLPTSGALSDIELSAINSDQLAVGTEDGHVAVLSSPPLHWKHAADSSGPVLVRWHPHAAGLLLTASLRSSTIAVWDLTASAPSQAISLTVQVGPKAAKGTWINDVVWSRDGTRIFAAQSDGTIKVYDPRQNPSEPVSSTQPPIGIPKPIRLTATSNYLLASTLNTSRQRELRIYAVDSVSAPKQIITLDTSSHPLHLYTTDYDRNLVFMASRGDVTMRWIELDDTAKFPQGAFPLPPRTTFSSAALAPPVALDVMKAEIDRIFVLSDAGGGASEVVPIRIEIPQRQLIDYHPHLFPDTPARTPALSAQQWLQGQDGQVQRWSLDPAKRQIWGAGQTQDSTAAPVASVVTPNENSVDQRADVPSTATQPSVDAKQVPLDTTTSEDKPSTAKEADTVVSAPDTTNAKAEVAQVAPSPSPAPVASSSLPASKDVSALSTPAAEPVRTSATAPTQSVTTATTTPSHAAWSRTTLTGVTPLLSAFTSVPSFDSSVAPAASSLVATPSYLLYPLAGPGGRLAFHEITRQGRLPESKDISWIETGGKVLDFAHDRFEDARVITGGEDGLKIWQLPSASAKLQSGGTIPSPPAEYKQEIVSQPERIIAVPQVGGRVSKVAFHPTAKDVVLVAGSEGVAIVDLASQDGAIKKHLQEPTSNEAEWSLDGSLVAFARSSDRKLVIWDPQTGSQGAISAHESSPRPFKMCWTDDDQHVITVGHGAGSMRQVRLFEVRRPSGSSTDSGSISLAQLGSTSLDTSPAILFPHYDVDTSILYLWSKGERSVSSVHLTLGALKPKFGSIPPLFKPLPAFQHGTPQVGLAFLPKRYVNVRDVEINIAYRLAKNDEIQRVTWKVERKRKEFFQDDVYPPTRHVEQSTFSGFDEWVQSGSNKDKAKANLPAINLKPDDMQLLSTAPPPETKVSTLPRGPSAKILTEKEREDELMNSVFDKAKKGRGEEHDLEETAARNRAPDDDDWDD